jgi:epoxyqueuosine reductase
MSEVRSRRQPAAPVGSAPREDSGVRALDTARLAALAARIKDWGAELGFGAVGIADVDVAAASGRLQRWLAAGRHGDMDYMARQAHLRADPSQLLPAGSRLAARVISARLDYLPRGR